MTEPPAEAVADIFISYARDDATFAAQLREGIEAGGFSVWMDTASMAGGEHYTKEIESAIEGATSVVVIVSASSNKSEWVRREVLYAQQLGKRVVPVFAAQVPLPVHLIDLNALALHGDFNVGLDRLLTALRGQTAGAAAAAGKRTPPVHIGKALWLFVGAAVVVVLVVIAVRGEGLVAEVLATGLAIGGVLLAMAWKADDAISLEFKRDLSLWLDGIDPAAVGRSMQRWPTHFAALFDRVFGKKHLSWSCFYRSSIASLLAFLLCTLIFMQAAPGEWIVFSSQAEWLDYLGSLGIIAAIFNLLPDYISLLETRWVVNRMQQAPSPAGQLGWLLADIVATAAIFLAYVVGVPALLVFLLSDWEEAALIASKIATNLMHLCLLDAESDPETRILAIPVWTTFFTTIWAWLYFLAQFLMRLATPLRRTLDFMKYALPVEQRPLRAVGQVMALTAFAGYFLVMLPVSTLGDGAFTSFVEPTMVNIKPGQFDMGCSRENEERCGASELPVHRVTFDKSFAIGKYEVTFEEYKHFARATKRPLPEKETWSSDNGPVINVTWKEATAYAEWLSEQTGHQYRLPTEAEWEYAARAGTRTKYWWGNKIGKNRANCGICSSQWDGKQTAPATSFDPNPWGLHNTAGNVGEWVQDCWHDNYSGFVPKDGSAWGEEESDCSMRVVRGGSWSHVPFRLRSAARDGVSADEWYYSLGFRLAQTLE